MAGRTMPHWVAAWLIDEQGAGRVDFAGLQEAAAWWSAFDARAELLHGVSFEVLDKMLASPSSTAAQRAEYGLNEVQRLELAERRRAERDGSS